MHTEILKMDVVGKKVFQKSIPKDFGTDPVFFAFCLPMTENYIFNAIPDQDSYQ